MSLKYHLVSFLSNSTNRTLKHARTSLITLRSIPIDGFSLSQSRSLWYSVILYHFRTEHVHDLLWSTAREFILTALREQDIRPIANAYLDLFEKWKEEDLKSLVHELASSYFNLIELKDAIERLPPQTIAEWRDSYVGLLNKIRNAAIKLNCLDKMEVVVHDMKRMKSQYVYDIMHKAYWDMLEEELIQNKNAILLCQLNELRSILSDISRRDEPDIERVIDTALCTVQERVFTKEDAWQLFLWCINSLRAWDSYEFTRLYDETLELLETMIQTEESCSRVVRILMEKSTVLALDLKTRKDIWKMLLSIPHE